MSRISNRAAAGRQQRSRRESQRAQRADRHGTSRVLFRNTRNRAKGFPKRELHQIRLPLPAQYQTAIKISGIMGARKSAKELARYALSEQIYQEFEGDSGIWWNFDPCVKWLMGYLTSHRKEEVLMICAKGFHCAAATAGAGAARA